MARDVISSLPGSFPSRHLACSGFAVSPRAFQAALEKNDLSVSGSATMAHRHSTRERRLVPRFVCMSLVCLVWSVVWVCVSTLGFAVRLSCGVHGVHYRALKMLGENEAGLADGGCRWNHFDPLVGIFPTMGVSTIRTITRSRMVTDRPTDQNTDRFVTVAQRSGTIGTDDDLDLLAYECPITGKSGGRLLYIQ